VATSDSRDRIGLERKGCLFAQNGVRRALNAADLEAAHQAEEPAIIADVEGLDFLDGKLERLEEAHERGIPHVQLMHYTPNDIGDFQTGAITHQGLTEFGAEVIRACDRLGFVCDVAHATEDMAKQAVKIATKPLLLSHTAVLGSPLAPPTTATKSVSDAPRIVDLAEADADADPPPVQTSVGRRC
jgi:membrane dipeptidase